ncbi:MAG: hypothetical protein HY276_07165, partial [Ignavibacteriales bacterium]|nr:hypothetical protein [Ignavibacteriales bacterium]
MKNITKLFSIFLFVCATHTIASAQEPSVDRIPVPLTDPGRPVFLKVDLISGSINVKSSSGKEVVVEARARFHEYGRKERNKEKDKSGGLKLIPNTSSGLTVEEDDNTVEVSTGWRGGSNPVDLTIQVPANTSMKLNTLNDGDIEVDGVTGNLEVSNLNGKVTLREISGSAIVDALNGRIVVTFVKVDTQKQMSFSSMNGDIDVTLPPSSKATMQLKNIQGEIYSDFDLAIEKTATKV